MYADHRRLRPEVHTILGGSLPWAWVLVAAAISGRWSYDLDLQRNAKVCLRKNSKIRLTKLF